MWTTHIHTMHNHLLGSHILIATVHLTTSQPNLGKPMPKALNGRFGFCNHRIQRIVSSLNCPNSSLSKIIQAKCGWRKYGSWNSCDVATNAKSSVLPGLMDGLYQLKGNVYDILDLDVELKLAKAHGFQVLLISYLKLPDISPSFLSFRFF